MRREILDVIELPMKHPYLFEHPTASPPVRNGILLYGPPGTGNLMSLVTDCAVCGCNKSILCNTIEGKTMVARAVATECKMAFLSIKVRFSVVHSYVTCV